ncbi:MAG: helix-turn-helix transcriptional regulator [Polaromonas sp.]
MREVLGTESVTAFGRRCGIGEGTLRSYLNGTLPVIDKAISIADAANVNIEWLATGRGPKMRGASLPSDTPALVKHFDTQPQPGYEYERPLTVENIVLLDFLNGASKLLNELEPEEAKRILGEALNRVQDAHLLAKLSRTVEELRATLNK